MAISRVATLRCAFLTASILTGGPACAQSASPADVQALIDRLNQLEARVQSLESENKALKEQAEFTTDRLESTENRAGKSVQAGVAPLLSDIAGDFTFKVRGVVDVDYASFTSRAGGYDYNTGTAFRRARLGFEGTAYRDFAWRMEADFVGNSVTLLDAYLQYTGIKPFVFTAGQHKAPFGLESNNSDSFNTFVERGMFTNAFGALGAERRIGLSAQYALGPWTATVGIFGDGEGQNRNNAGPDESYGVNGRVTWEPINDVGRIIHLGASGYWRSGLRVAPSGTQTVAPENSIRITERPNVRVDGGNIIDSGVIPNVTDLYYGGVEGALVYGSVSLIGEYGHLTGSRKGQADIQASGFYTYLSWFITGESRGFRGGNFDRLRPFDNLDLRTGGLGAFEIAGRYDRFGTVETPVVARQGNDAQSTTLALNWYFNPNMKLQFNWIRFWGNNTPLDPLGSRTAGDSYVTRVHLDW